MVTSMSKYIVTLKIFVYLFPKRNYYKKHKSFLTQANQGCCKKTRSKKNHLGFFKKAHLETTNKTHQKKNFFLKKSTKK